MPSRRIVILPSEDQKTPGLVGESGPCFPMLAALLGFDPSLGRCSFAQEFPQQPTVFIGMSNRIAVVRTQGLKKFLKMVGGLVGRRFPSILTCCGHQHFIVPPLVLLPLVEPPSGASIGLFVALCLFAMVENRPTTSSPNEWIIAMSRSSFVVRGLLHPTLCTKVSLVVPEMNALITLASARLVSSLHCHEKH
jgi:hypothetical protein